MQQHPPLKFHPPEKSSKPGYHIHEGLILLLLVALAFLSYSNTLESPFIFDDMINIKNNPNMHLTELTFENIKKAAFEAPCPNRPISNISFALNYFFHQHSVRGYHLVNIIIHISSGLLLYLFVKTTLIVIKTNQLRLHTKNNSIADEFSNPSFIAFFTALIWLVHPIQTQSVTYIVQRMNSMAAMFYILSFLLYAKARLAEKRWKRLALFTGSLLAGVLALGSKETAATLPFFIILYEWYFFADMNRDWLKRHLITCAVILILSAFLTYIYLGADPLERILSDYRGRDFTLAQRVLTEFRVVIFYIGLLIFPHPSRLSLEHDFALSYSLTDPVTTWLSMGTIILLIGLAVWMAKKDRLLSFCILWFFGNLFIESSVIGLEIIFEHRNYLPSMLACLMFVMLIYRYIKPQWLMFGILCVTVMVCSVWTFERNITWSNGVTLWGDSVAKSPQKARPRVHLGFYLVAQGRHQEAIRHLSEALRIDPNYAEAHNLLGIALERREDLKKACFHYSEAVRLLPQFAKAHNNLGHTLLILGKTPEAIRHLSAALRIKPDFAMAHNNIGVALQSQGSMKKAIGHFSEALRIQPDYHEARKNLKRAVRLIEASSP